MIKHVRIGNMPAILHIPSSKNPPAVVMVHGFSGDGFVGEFEDVANNLCKNGYFVLRFLFSGYSEGSESDLSKLTVSGEVSELKSVIEFLEKQKIDKTRIGIVAQSLGGSVSILLNDSKIKTMVLLAPVVYLKKWFMCRFGKKDIERLESTGGISIVSRLGKKLELGLSFWEELKLIEKISEKQIRKISCPLLIIHSKDDKLIPYTESETLFSAVNSPKKLILLEGAGHVTIRDPEIRKEIINYILKFLSKYL